MPLPDSEKIQETRATGGCGGCRMVKDGLRHLKSEGIWDVYLEYV